MSEKDNSETNNNNEKSKKRMFHKYSDIDLQKALKTMRENDTPICAASKVFGVPRTKLSDILHGQVSEDTRRMGPAPYLSVQGEEQLITWITNSAKSGFPVKKYRLLHTVQKIVRVIY